MKPWKRFHGGFGWVKVELRKVEIGWLVVFVIVNSIIMIIIMIIPVVVVVVVDDHDLQFPDMSKDSSYERTLKEFLHLLFRFGNPEDLP